MKKIAIITLYGNFNFGNKLQNYALETFLKKINTENTVSTLLIKYQSKHIIKKIYHNIIGVFQKNEIINKKTAKFLDFNKEYINYTKKNYANNPIINKKINNYDYFVFGSDQIWNPSSGGNSKLSLGYLTDNNITYAASFGISSLPQNLVHQYQNGLKNFHSISVREFEGQKIVQDLIKNKDIPILIDPTMLLTAKEWDKISKRPFQLNIINKKKYILNCFLGRISDSRKKEINRIAEENDCYVINIMDKNDLFYEIGPCEFLYLEKNAFLICTDSFHSSVFALLYNKPFIIFDREQKHIENMNSRIDTLINKFKLKNRRFNNEKITIDNINHDYTEAYKILEIERKKSKVYLKKALDIK